MTGERENMSPSAGESVVGGAGRQQGGSTASTWAWFRENVQSFPVTRRSKVPSDIVWGQSRSQSRRGGVRRSQSRHHPVGVMTLTHKCWNSCQGSPPSLLMIDVFFFAKLLKTLVELSRRGKKLPKPSLGLKPRFLPFSHAFEIPPPPPSSDPGGDSQRAASSGPRPE